MDIALRPFLRRKFLLTRAEKSFYNILRKIVAPHAVLAKVRLADLVEADKRHWLWRANFNRVSSKHIDFVICDLALSPIIAVELDDSSHRLPERVARDRDVNRILEIASLPLLRIPVQKAYDEVEISKQLLATLHPAG